MDYSALTGTFFIIDRNIDNAMEHWNVTYLSNDADCYSSGVLASMAQ